MVSQPNVLAQKQGILRLQKWIDSAQKPMDIAKKIKSLLNFESYWPFALQEKDWWRKYQHKENIYIHYQKEISISEKYTAYLREADLWKVTMSLQRKQTIAVVIV